MSLNFVRWPFALPEARQPEEDERWWADCYLPHSVVDTLESRSQWCFLVGGPQCGKSTALAALRRKWQGHALLLQDDFLLPSQQEKTQGNILYRILGQASSAFRHHLSEHPDRFSKLSQTQLEFLHWSIEKFHGRRAFLLWLDGLLQEFAQVMQNIEFEDLYPSQTSNVEEQIDELVNFSRRLGYQQVMVTADTSPFPTNNQLQEIRRILGWLEPMQYSGLKLAMALPPIVSAREAKELSRGRAAILEMDATIEHTRSIIEHHLSVATEGTIQKIEKFCSSKLVESIQMLVENEFHTPAVGTWLKIIEILLETAGDKEILPLKVDSFPQIQLSFYTHFMPLRLEPEVSELGVWRGYTWIPLDRAIYEFLGRLVSNKGRHIYEISGKSKGNLHTLASRLRAAIEPVPSQTIYLKNTKGEGYWLENYVPSLSFETTRMTG